MKYRKHLLLSLLGLSLTAGLGTAQEPGIPQRRPGSAQGRPGGQGMTPTILKGPSDWRFERMPVPPGFAPEIKLKGFEEARFSPGMFDNSSANYFTYILVISADGAQDLGAADLKDFLEKYYRGLSVGVGRRKGLSPDPAQMIADVTRIESGQDARNRYMAGVVFFDSFTDGRKLTLNVEAHVIPRPGSKKTYLTLLVSPHAKDAAEWKTLREIESNLQFPEP